MVVGFDYGLSKPSSDYVRALVSVPVSNLLNAGSCAALACRLWSDRWLSSPDGGGAGGHCDTSRS